MGDEQNKRRERRGIKEKRQAEKEGMHWLELGESFYEGRRARLFLRSFQVNQSRAP